LNHTLSTPLAAPEASPQDLLLAKFPTWTLAHWCITVAAASFLILALLPEGRLNDFDISNGAENVRIARSLASRRAFADPFASFPTGTTAHAAPVYPWVYSLILRAFGTGHTALQILWTCNVMFLAVQFGLLPLVSYRLHFGVLPGIVAAALGTLSLYSPMDTRWECFFAGLLLVLAFLATQRSLSSHSRTAPIAAGALWGVLVLTYPVFILLLLVWPICWTVSQPAQCRGSVVMRCMVIAGVALLVLSPWIVRNYSRFGTFIFIRDNLGLELYTANNPCAAPSLRENIQSGCHFRTHPNPNAVVAAQLAAAGEINFNRTKLQQALDWMKKDPSAFLSLTARRVRLFWLPDLDRKSEMVLVWLITFLSVPGLLAMGQKNPTAAALLATAWLFFPMIYYITQFDPRYRYPILWTSLLPAGYALVKISRLPFFHPTVRKSVR
jgi:hypothetical protein